MFIEHLLNVRLRESRKMVNLMESYFSCTKGHISDLVTFELRPEPTIQRVRDLLSNWLGTAGAKTLKQQSLAVGALGGQFHRRIVEGRGEVGV